MNTFMKIALILCFISFATAMTASGNLRRKGEKIGSVEAGQMNVTTNFEQNTGADAWSNTWTHSSTNVHFASQSSLAVGGGVTSEAELLSAEEALALSTLLENAEDLAMLRYQRDIEANSSDDHTESRDLLCSLAQSFNSMKNARFLLPGDKKLPTLPGTCAVVSNSGVLRSQRLGNEIDKADLVIRFNDAPVGGEYAPIVGTRDDIRIVNEDVPKGWLSGKSDIDDKVVYVVVPMQRKIDRWKDTVDALKEVASQKQGAKVLRVRHDLPDVTGKVLSGMRDDADATDLSKSRKPLRPDQLPSSGAFAMMMALSMCKEVRAYGMAQTLWSNNFPFSYYDTDRRMVIQALVKTGLLAEKDVWRRLALNADDVDRSDVAIIPGFASNPCSPTDNKYVSVLEDGSKSSASAWHDWVSETFETQQ